MLSYTSEKKKVVRRACKGASLRERGANGKRVRSRKKQPALTAIPSEVKGAWLCCCCYTAAGLALLPGRTKRGRRHCQALLLAASTGKRVYARTGDAERRCRRVSFRCANISPPPYRVPGCILALSFFFFSYTPSSRSAKRAFSLSRQTRAVNLTVAISSSSFFFLSLSVSLRCRCDLVW